MWLPLGTVAVITEHTNTATSAKEEKDSEGMKNDLLETSEVGCANMLFNAALSPANVSTHLLLPIQPLSGYFICYYWFMFLY